MDKIKSIRVHARAGQGAKTTSQIIADTALAAGKFIQAFPYYGPEREGAPMMSFVRICKKPITIHSLVTDPDIVLVNDRTLARTEPVANGLKPDGFIIVNSTSDTKFLAKKINYSGKIYPIGATEIALEKLGRDITNTVMLGALAKLCPLIDLKVLLKIIEQKFTKKLGYKTTKANLSAVVEGFNLIEK